MFIPSRKNAYLYFFFIVIYALQANAVSLNTFLVKTSTLIVSANKKINLFDK
jgi:hypothetical protein